MKNTRNVLITGAGGYLGSETIKAISNDPRFKTVIGVDVRDKPSYLENYTFTHVKSDIRSEEEMLRLMKENTIDTVVHLAAIVTPGKNPDRDFEYSVDVLGTKNILECCVKAGVKKIIVTSSGAAYGYYPDNPEWIKETDQIRGNFEFAYSHHKKLVEEMLADYRIKHPELKQLIFRIGTILGVTTKNQITEIFQRPLVIGIRGAKSPFVFIWDKDVVNCLVQGIIEDKEGAYNLAGNGALTMREISRILKKPYVSVPASFLKAALTVLKKFKMTGYGPEQVNFLRYRPVLANDKLKKEFGYTPLKSSRETFLYYLENKSS